MMYSNEEALHEILKRSIDLQKKKKQRSTQLLCGTVGILTAGLILTIALFAGGGPAGITNPAYGAFLLPAEAGGYILIALIAFAAGVILTLLIRKHRNDRPEGSSGARREYNNETHVTWIPETHNYGIRYFPISDVAMSGVTPRSR